MAGKFQKATRTKIKLRFALSGPSGSGKTYTALKVASFLGGPIALIDTEDDSSRKYAKLPGSNEGFDFDFMNINAPFHPQKAIDAIADAVSEGYKVIIIDSLTHFWNEEGGFLALVDQESKKPAHRNNSFSAWKVIDPLYRQLMRAILEADADIIFCMRSKQDYSSEKDSNGKTQIKKLGMAPEFRAGAEYQADIEGQLDMEHNLIIGKTRCHALDGKVFHKAGKDIAKVLRGWLDAGEDAPVQSPVQESPKPAHEGTKPAVTEEQRSLCVEYLAKLAEATTRKKATAVKDELGEKIGRDCPIFMTDFRQAFVAKIKSLPEEQPEAVEQANGVAQ